MGHKVDLAEVIAFSDKVTKAADEIALDTDVARKNISTIDSMNTFTGYAATNAKKYLNDLHVTLLESFDVLHTVMKENTKNHIDTFKSSVDTSDEAIVQTEYLNETKMWIEIDHKNIVNSEESVIKTLDSISDIVYISKPSLEDAKNDYENMMETIEKLDENLNTFTTKGKKDDSLEKDLLDNIKVTISKANASKGDARFKEYKHGSEGSSLVALRNIVSGAKKGADIIEAHHEERMKKKQEQKQKNQKSKPKPPVVKQKKQTFWSKAKSVGKKALTKTKEGFIGKNTIPHRTLGIMGSGLMYTSNYHEAKDQGKTGFGAHVHAAEDTAIDVAIGAATVVAATAVVGTFLAPGILATAAVITIGVVAGKILGDWKIGKSKKSVTDRVKGGYRKIKGWFK